MINNTPDKYIQRMQEVTDKKYILLQDMVLLTQEQSNTITEEGLYELEKLVSCKQLKIDEIDKLDEEFNVYFQRLKHELKVNSLEEAQTSGIIGVKELQEAVKDVKDLIVEIMNLEKANSEKTKNLLDLLGDEIKKVSVGKAANSAYKIGQNTRQPSYFMDQKK